MKTIPTLRESLVSIFETMIAAYDSNILSGKSAAIEFTLIHGTDKHVFTLAATPDNLSLLENANSDAQLKIVCSAYDWIKIAGKRLNPVVAIVTGKLKFKGDISLLKAITPLKKQKPELLIENKKNDSFSIKNIVAISGSPRGKDSFTEMYLSELLKDVNKNVNISRFILSEMNIKSCLGCCKCWSILAGKCCIVDDMKIILEKIKTADLIIYAFPLYIYNVPGIFKNFLDRQLVLSEPFMAKNGNKTSHPHVITKPQKFFVLSHCGFPENIHFEGIKKIFSLRSDRSYSQLIGFLTIPAGSELIKNPTIYDEMCKKIDALNAIGRQLIDNGTINSKMAKIVSKEISNKRKIAWRIDASEFWQNKIDTGSSDY